VLWGLAQNPKLEIRNPKQLTAHGVTLIFDFVLRNCFGIGASDFEFLGKAVLWRAD
jgi:hypothetical protein